MKISNVKRKAMQRRNKLTDELLDVNAKEIMEEARNTLGEAKRCLRKLKRRKPLEFATKENPIEIDGDDDETIKLWFCNGDCDCDNFDDENDNCFDYRDDECVDPRELKCFGMSKRKYDLMSLRKLATQLLFDEVQLLPEFNADIVKKTKEVLDAIDGYIHLENNEETEND